MKITPTARRIQDNLRKIHPALLNVHIERVERLEHTLAGKFP